MCEWGKTVKLKIRGKVVDVDSCIAPMVQMFNDNGYETIASCCGHGKIFGNIALTDGRFIDIHADRASWERKDERIKKLVYKNKTLKKRAEFAEGDWQVAEQIVDQLKTELKQHRWIPVSEGLPKKIKNYFKSKDCFVTDGKEVWVAAYNFSAYYWQCPSSKITHWKPIILPE